MSDVLLPARPVTSLDGHLARGGGQGLEVARASTADAVVATLRASGLRGRGGAGFPAGAKWASILAGGPDVGDRYVVANGAEGEPGSFKDRALLAANPYQVLEGLHIAAEVVGARHAFVALKASFVEQAAALARALDEMEGAGMIGAVPTTIVSGPEEYLFGEEKALLEVVEGEDPLPRLLPPYIYGLFTTDPQMGWSAGVDADPESRARVRANPTLVSNVETLANVGPILRHGPGWYRSMGTAASPGVALCTVVGDVRRAGVAEVELGVPLSEVLVAIGGGVAPGRRFKAALSGVANPVVTETTVDTPLCYEAMERAGTGLGACGFVVYDDTADMAAVARMVSRFLFVESCGQCPPCKLGTGDVTDLLDRVLAGGASMSDVEQIGERLSRVADANRCFLPVQAQRVVGSILRAFPEDFVAHLEGRAAPPAELPVPKIVDIRDGVARYDERQRRKRPDWTYEPA